MNYQNVNRDSRFVSENYNMQHTGHPASDLREPTRYLLQCLLYTASETESIHGDRRLGAQCTEICTQRFSVHHFDVDKILQSNIFFSPTNYQNVNRDSRFVSEKYNMQHNLIFEAKHLALFLIS